MSKYWKSIIAAAVAAAITVLQVVITQRADEVWTTEDTLVTVLAFLGAIGVYFKANVTDDPAAHRDQSVVG